MKSMVQYDEQAQQVWAATNIERKKEILIEMINSFTFKKKADQFRSDVVRATSSQKLDKLVSDIMLVGHGYKVI